MMSWTFFLVQDRRRTRTRTFMMTCPLLSSANAMYVWYEISPYLSQFLEGTTTCILVILYSHEWTSQWL